MADSKIIPFSIVIDVFGYTWWEIELRPVPAPLAYVSINNSGLEFSKIIKNNLFG